MSPKPKGSSRYDPNRLWGLIGLAAALVLVVVAATMKDLRWLLIVAWPFASLAALEGTKALKSHGREWAIAISLSAAVALFWLWMTLTPIEPKKAATLPSAKEIAEEVAKRLPTQNFLSLHDFRVRRQDGTFLIMLEFKPSRNETLGYVDFTFSLPSGTDAKILKCDALITGGTNPEEISSDGRTARLDFAPAVSCYPNIWVTLSKLASLHVTGNKLTSAIDLPLDEMWKAYHKAPR